MTEYINYGKTTLNILTDKVEKKYNAKYIGDFALMRPNGWAEVPAQVYWQPVPPVQGYSHYFGLIIRYDSNDEPTVYITTAASLEDVEFSAIRSGDEILYSRYRHDYRTSKDGKCSIDGGRDYTRIIGTPDEVITLKLFQNKLIVVDGENIPDENPFSISLDKIICQQK